MLRHAGPIKPWHDIHSIDTRAAFAQRQTQSRKKETVTLAPQRADAVFENFRYSSEPTRC
jgi:predicted ATPase